METQETLESRVLDAQKRQGPMAGPILMILQSQDRMEANVATLAAAYKSVKAFMDECNNISRAPNTPIARFFWRMKI